MVRLEVHSRDDDPSGQFQLAHHSPVNATDFSRLPGNSSSRHGSDGSIPPPRAKPLDEFGLTRVPPIRSVNARTEDSPSSMPVFDASTRKYGQRRDIAEQALDSAWSLHHHNRHHHHSEMKRASITTHSTPTTAYSSSSSSQGTRTGFVNKESLYSKPDEEFFQNFIIDAEEERPIRRMGATRSQHQNNRMLRKRYQSTFSGFHFDNSESEKMSTDKSSGSKVSQGSKVSGGSKVSDDHDDDSYSGSSTALDSFLDSRLESLMEDDPSGASRRKSSVATPLISNPPETGIDEQTRKLSGYSNGTHDDPVDLTNRSRFRYQDEDVDKESVEESLSTPTPSASGSLSNTTQVAKKRICLRRRRILFAIILASSLSLLCSTHRQYKFAQKRPPSPLKLSSSDVPDEIKRTKCAILMFGLPRSFLRLVLPSLERHVIRINEPKYNCDWFVHWYIDAIEEPSRSGHGGTLDSFEAMKQALKDAISRHHSNSADGTTVPPRTRPMPKIQFATDTNATFWERHGTLMNTIFTEKGKRKFRKEHSIDPRLLYWPVKDKSYQAETLVNIVKMWHSIQNAYELVIKSGIVYDRVAVLRSDVMFLTPVDVWSRAPNTNQTTQKYYDIKNKNSVVPGGFAMYPINDRFIYGPADAVRIWATERFNLLEDHVHKTILDKEPGFGMHNERFLFYSIFPRIHYLEYDMELCLVRVRADGSVWINDCGVVDENVQIIEQLLLRGQTCQRPLQPLDPNIHTRVIQLFCDNVPVAS